MACSGLLRTFYLCRGVHLLFILQLSNSCDSEWPTFKNMALLRIQVPRTTRHVHILHPGLLAAHVFICGGTVYYSLCEYVKWIIIKFHCVFRKNVDIFSISAWTKPTHQRDYEGSIIKTYSQELSEYRWFFIDFFFEYRNSGQKIKRFGIAFSLASKLCKPSRD